jgi:hydroxymethylglutaryl-CoA reductase (NADPH)
MSEGLFYDRIPRVPGRGFNTSQSVKLRQDYLKSLKLDFERLFEHQLPLDEINHNIESFIGSVEIPVGLVGPVAYRNVANANTEAVFIPAATLEGALVYSMNRGARVIALSGGFDSEFHYQRMLRAPMFILDSDQNAKLLEAYINSHFIEIKSVAESYSNHAKLVEIKTYLTGYHLNTKFYYQTGDAAGQNMTTTCTWHALLHIVAEFEKLYPGLAVDYVIEGNGAADKKISQYNIEHGRGCKVSASVEVSDDVLKDVLRVDSHEFLKFYHPSKVAAEKEGMLGYNINVANALASIFLATGQDAACLHESSTAFFNVEKSEGGLRFELILPNLVVGTVGGGTHLQKQKEALQMMGCHGRGKLERFSRIICGAALGLEISTFGAIVSGEFARAHQKLGRNKPVNWLLKSEVTTEFVQECLFEPFNKKVTHVELQSHEYFDNGIITQLTTRVTSKLQGYYLVNINHEDQILLKSRPTSEEVFKGLHLVASGIDSQLAALILEERKFLEFHDCHYKEIQVTQWLNQIDYPYYPKLYGVKEDAKREMFLLFQRFIHPSETKILNSENHPEIWEKHNIERCIEAIHEFHDKQDAHELTSPIQFQQPWKAEKFYKRLNYLFLEALRKDKLLSDNDLYALAAIDLHALENEMKSLNSSMCFIHNDFNPRNVMILKNGEPMIYDWELCVFDFPHRDVMEFLSFLDLNDANFLFHAKMHAELKGESWQVYSRVAQYSLKCLLITRFSLYYVSGGAESHYEFAPRVIKTALRYWRLLSNT